MAIAFHSGFECGNTIEWVSVTTLDGGTLTIQSSIKKTGAYAMRCYSPKIGRAHV